MKCAIAAALALTACGSQNLTARIQDGTYSARAFADRIAEEHGEDFVLDEGVYLDAELDLRDTEATFTVDGAALTGAVRRTPERQWRRQCKGGHYMLNPADRTRAEWIEVVFETPVILPDVPDPVARLVVEGQTHCGLAVLDTVILTAEAEDRLQYSLTDAVRID